MARFKGSAASNRAPRAKILRCGEQIRSIVKQSHDCCVIRDRGVDRLVSGRSLIHRRVANYDCDPSKVLEHFGVQNLVYSSNECQDAEIVLDF